uniref:ubiquitinyl hydrolase 1 n=1 Tax=Ciona savignyi TaxID=51511 RepID=H2Z994_CIOSA
DRSRSCPYLDTINRSLLDFDFEKLCSVSLSHLNVYACLVCGKYFQGRGRKSHAYTHSVEFNHHVFLNLYTLKFYCLPDNYMIVDSSLEDITYVLNPTFTKPDIRQLSSDAKLMRAYDGTTYLPGIVGLNNIKANDYCNVVLQALSHVPPLRNYFLREENYSHIKRPPGDIMILLSQRFGELIRKLWNPRNFKAHVSPHEMLQSIVLCSRKRFQITKQGDPLDLLTWFLNSMNVALNGSKKRNSSKWNQHFNLLNTFFKNTNFTPAKTPILTLAKHQYHPLVNLGILTKTFQGEMKIYSRKIPSPETLKKGNHIAPTTILTSIFPFQPEDIKQKLLKEAEYQETMERSPFLYLALDLPAAPLYKDELEHNIIPQVPLATLLAKFNGQSEKGKRDSTMKRFEITRLPPYLIFYIKRFTKNLFFIEKNPTIVNFPVTNIDLEELIAVDADVPNTCYDLVANIVHDGDPNEGKGSYRVHILHQSPVPNKWYELQDLHVSDILPQMITLSEAYIQIWALRKGKKADQENA